MIRIEWAATLVALGLINAARAAGPDLPLIEPSELSSRTDLVGREVAVDDRIAFFQYHKGRDFDELKLKRTSVIFRLPVNMRYKHPPTATAARVQGTLARDGDLLVCDVTALEILPNDLKRLDGAVNSLPPQDFEGRASWARWAERRGSEFKDQALLQRARDLDAEAIRIEAERPSADPARHWLTLAERARKRHVPEPEPSALAHRAFQAMRATARTADELDALASKVEAFLPEARKPRPSVEDLAQWSAPYAKSPAAAYRSAPEPVRGALDHRLWADLTQRALELRAEAEPQNALTLAETAITQLPDRPEAADRLLERGMQSATRDVGALRRTEVETLAKVYREKLHQPERARDLYRSWLNDQRDHRLSPSDAEGRVALANQYETLLGDRATAIELLRKAWQIDPQSRDVADAFRRHGYRRSHDDWVEPAPERATADAAHPETSAPSDPSLRGLFPEQIRARLGGKPDRIVRVASQGQLSEQWIYLGVRQDQYVNFVQHPGEARPRSVSYYSRPRTGSDSNPPR